MPVDRTHAQRALTHSQLNVAAAPGLTAAPPVRQDVDSFRARLDDHYVLMTNASAGTYYVGVYNNDNYIKARARRGPTRRGRVALLAGGVLGQPRCSCAALCACQPPVPVDFLSHRHIFSSSVAVCPLQCCTASQARQRPGREAAVRGGRRTGCGPPAAAPHRPTRALSFARALKCARAQEAAHYTLQARWGGAGAAPLCPGDCGGAAAGACIAPGVCSCVTDRGAWRGGRWCEGPLALLPLGGEQRGVLAPGRWAYWEVRRGPHRGPPGQGGVGWVRLLTRAFSGGWWARWGHHASLVRAHGLPPRGALARARRRCCRLASVGAARASSSSGRTMRRMWWAQDPARPVMG
jgi:hypothetical protein